MFFVNIEPRIFFNDAMSSGNRADITAALRTAYEGSSVFQRLVDRWLSDDEHRIAINYVPGALAAIGNFSGTIVIDPAAVEDLQYIDNNGTARSETLITSLVHELIHALSQFQDNGVNENPSSWDYRGDTVARSNLIYRELGLPEQNSYVAVDGTGGLILENGFEYTNGAEIDRSWVWNPDVLLANGAIRMDWDTSNIWNSDDLLIGAELSNVLTSGGGDDFIYGGRGFDTLDGGRGHDFLHGGTGTQVRDLDDDQLTGGHGNDILVGGWGSDTLDGGSGRDLLIATDFGARYTDFFSNTLIGGTGDDVLVSSAGGGVLDGGQGNDLIIGGEGDETINGGSNADYIYTGGGADIIRGGAGDDWINATAPGSAATVILDANSGRDYIQPGTDGARNNGVSEIVFEDISVDDVQLLWSYDSIIWELVFVNYEDRIDDENEPLPIATYVGNLSGSASIRVESTGASINIGSISGSISRTDYHIGRELTSAIDAQTFNVSAQLQNDMILTFDDFQFTQNAPGGSPGIIDLFENYRLADETYVREDTGLIAWDDVRRSNFPLSPTAPENFANGFSNPYVRDDVNLLDPVTDYGLIGTTDAFGLLI